MDIKDYYNDLNCICTANLNEEEVYILLFEYKKNNLFNTLESKNDSKFKLSKLENNKIKFSFKITDSNNEELEYKSIIEETSRKNFNKVYLLVVDNVSGDIFLMYYNDYAKDSNKNLAIKGILINNPSTLNDVLEENKEILITNFFIGITGNGKF